MINVRFFILYYLFKYLFIQLLVDLKAFTYEIETIYDILAKNGYIECTNTNKMPTIHENI